MCSQKLTIRTLIIILTILCSRTSKAYLSDVPIVDDLAAVLDDGWDFYTDHKYEEMSLFLESQLYRFEDQDSLRMEMQYALAMAYGHLDKHDKLFESVIEGLLLAQKIDNHWMLLSLYRELGSLHDHPLKDREAALYYMKKAIPYLDAVKANSKCGLMMDIGLTSTNAGQLDSAQHYYNKAFEYLKEDERMTRDVYSFYYPFLLKSGRLEEASFYLDYTYSAWQERGFVQGFTESCIGLAELYHRQGAFNKSIGFAQEAYQKGQEIENVFYQADAIEWLAKSQESIGKKEQSLDSYKTLHALRDSIEILEEQQNLDKKRLAFVTAEYQDELSIINEYNKRLTTVNSVSQMALYGTSLSLLFIGLISYYSYRSKSQEIEELNHVLSLTAEEQKKLEEEYLQAVHELEKNKRELTSTALFIEKKDEALKSVRKILSKISSETDQEVLATIKSARRLAHNSINIDNNWDSFRYFFEQVYPSFHKAIKQDYPQLNQNELRYLSYIKIGLTDKEAARLLGINTASFQKSKYRLKKKLILPKEDSVGDMLNRY